MDRAQGRSIHAGDGRCALSAAMAGRAEACAVAQDRDGPEEPERQRGPRAKRNDGREADSAKVPICPILALILINGEMGGWDYPCVMDVRFEVLRIHNVWTLTHSGPEVKSFGSRIGAITAGIAEACRHHERDG